jgi:glutathione synthase/RimK-type ligase-like ATP-grasp enzyme
MSLVLILTNAADKTSALVENDLKTLGVNYVRLNTKSFGSDSSIAFNLVDSTPGFVIIKDGNQISGDDIHSIWYRRPVAPEVAHLHQDFAVAQFVRAELESALYGVLFSLRCKWISHPSSIRLASHKIAQLNAATRLGFDVPKTIVSMNPDDIRQFYKALRSEGKRTVAKLVSKGPPHATAPEHQYCVYTSVLSDADLESSVALSVCPATYQEYVDKKYELRVTVVGEKVFACEIHSQATEKTSVDWRRYDLPNTPHVPHRLEPLIEERCIALTKYFGLRFSAIDLILTPDNRLVFLELNPNGQWGWIQELTGQPISMSLAQLLASVQDEDD